MSHDQAEKLMWSLPAQRRCAMLTFSLIEKDSEAVAAILALLNCAGAMAQLLSGAQRFEIAEKVAGLRRRDRATSRKPSSPFLS